MPQENIFVTVCLCKSLMNRLGFNSATPLQQICEFIPFQGITMFCSRQIGQNFGGGVSLCNTSCMNNECLSWFYCTKIINYAQFIALISFPFISQPDCFLFVFFSTLTARIKFIVMAKACQQKVLPRHYTRPCGRFLLIIRSTPFST